VLETIGSRTNGPEPRKSPRSRFLSALKALLWLALGLAFALSFILPQATILWHRTVVFFVGIALMLAGIAFRFYAMSLLGRFFTYNVLFMRAKQSSRLALIATSAILRKTLGSKSSRAEIKGLNVMRSALPDVERFS